MKKKVLLYLVMLVSTVSLQSCVTNYVVSKPTTYIKDNKSDANYAAIDSKRLEMDKKQLISSFVTEKSVALSNAKNKLKSSEIAKAIKYNKVIDNILTEAETYLGTPYRYGGTTRKGIDCSAFVLSVFGAATSLNLPRVAASQAQEGESIDKTELQKGDLVFFSHGRRISHVGIVESISEDGDIKFIHAATSKGVMVSSLSDSYWGPKFRFAKRVIDENGDHYNASAKLASQASLPNF